MWARTSQLALDTSLHDHATIGLKLRAADIVFSQFILVLAYELG